MALLAAAGDPGGLRALLPALQAYAASGGAVTVWKHRDLPAALPGAPLWEGGALPKVDRLVFATSVADAGPLALARRCRAAGIRVECVLDNWMNYRRRLELDGGGLFVPDAYYVMDEAARAGALREGLPAEVLVVSGHPALGELKMPGAVQREKLRRELGAAANDRLVVFVSEPAEKDQGSDASSPDFRGYTEKHAIAALCEGLRAAGGAWAVGLLPHPREDAGGLEKTWRANAASLGGGVLPAGFMPSRELIAAADGVAGMTSILLYEAWLMGRPTLSLQPGLIREDLRIFRDRPGVVCIESRADPSLFAQWVAQVRAGGGSPRPEIAAHQHAAAFLAARWARPATS
jgi:hypothetical protein